MKSTPHFMLSVNGNGGNIIDNFDFFRTMLAEIIICYFEVLTKICEPLFPYWPSYSIVVQMSPPCINGLVITRNVDVSVPIYNEKVQRLWVDFNITSLLGKG